MEFVIKYSFLIIAGLIVVVFLGWAIFRGTNETASKNVKRSFWDYYFIWPILLSQKKGDQTVQRGFNRREWVWVIILIVIAILAVIFTPTEK